MQPINILILVCLILSFVLFVLYSVSTFIFQSKHKELSILNSYEYEFSMQMNTSKRLINYFLILINMILECLILFFSLYYIKTIFSLMLAIMTCVSALCFTIGFITPLSNPKRHLILVVVGVLLSIGSNIMLGFVKVITGALFLDSDFSLAISIVLAVFGFLGLLSLFNPKLKDWAHLEKAEENGKTIYVKPKINFFAFYEWIYLLIIELSTLLIALNFTLNLNTAEVFTRI